MRLIEKVWFEKHPAKFYLVPLLLPLTGLFWLLSRFRKLFYKLNIKRTQAVDCPIVVVGNIGIGGNGKTPVVIYLVEQLKAQGVKVGVISRGYGSKAETYPYVLTDASIAAESGDEPLLIYRRCKVPVAVGVNRVAAANRLISQGCQIIISDDGLQHYALARDYEICVIDSERLFGNGLLLPSGPLREGISRLNSVDHVIFNGKLDDVSINTVNIMTPYQTMILRGLRVCNLLSGEYIDLSTFVNQHKTVEAIAGIGNPNRFFNYLLELGFTLRQQQSFDDHQAYYADELKNFTTDTPLLMTEKDAVKCYTFGEKNWWYLPVDAEFTGNDNNKLVADIMQLLKK
jgi:tetraacyldisaccharide 4'-kinase